MREICISFIFVLGTSQIFLQVIYIMQLCTST